MRNLKYIILLGIAFAEFSCQKKFLSQVPNDKLTIDQVFQRKDLSEEYLAHVYSYIPVDVAYPLYDPWEGLSDEADIIFNRPGSNDYATYQMNLGEWSATSNYYNYWPSYYNAIRSASYFMAHIGENKQILALANGADLIKQYTAEARFCRAFYYFCLLKQYGPVILLPENPVAVDAQTDDPLLSLPRSPYDSCVDYIANQLDMAAEELPLNSSNQSELDYGRATKAACMAVKSRLLLYAASPQFNGNKDYAGFQNQDGTPLIDQQYDLNKWKRAADAAKAVIDLGLFSLYKENDAQGQFSPYLSCRDAMLKPWNNEWIFADNVPNAKSEIGLTPRSGGGYAADAPPQGMVDAFEMANGQRPVTGYQSDGTPIVNPASGYSETGFTTFQAPGDPEARETYNMYVNREPRFYVDITYNNAIWINTTSSHGIITCHFNYSGESGAKGSFNYPASGYLWRKNVSPDSDPSVSKYVKRPYVMFRYAEILLNYVEALNEYDPGNSDINKYLNMIRERAGVPQYGTGPNALPVPGSQTAMRDAIHHERQVELCFEDKRYFDTRRWKIADQTDGGPFYGMDIDQDPPQFYKRKAFETRVFLKNYYLFPIPQSELDRDENLVQNPGW